MNSRKTVPPLEPAAILERMKHGKTYKAFEIAERMARPTSVVRSLLDDMVDRGQLDLIKVGERARRYRKPHSQYPTVPDELHSDSIPGQEGGGIARPRQSAFPCGSLTGYDEEFRQRMELAMLSRKR